MYGISLHQHIVIQCTIYMSYKCCSYGLNWRQSIVNHFMLKNNKIGACHLLWVTTFEPEHVKLHSATGPVFIIKDQMLSSLCQHMTWPRLVPGHQQVHCWLHSYNFLPISCGWQLFCITWPDHVIQNGRFRKIRALIIPKIRESYQQVTNPWFHITCVTNQLFIQQLQANHKKLPKFHASLALCEWNPPVTGRFPSQRANDAESNSVWWNHHDLSWLRPFFFFFQLCSMFPLSGISVMM